MTIPAGQLSVTFDIDAVDDVEASDVAAFLLPGVKEKAGIAYRYYEGSWAKVHLAVDPALRRTPVRGPWAGLTTKMSASL